MTITDALYGIGVVIAAPILLLAIVLVLDLCSPVHKP